VSETTSSLVAIARALHSQHIKTASDQWISAMRAIAGSPDDEQARAIDLILAAENMTDAALRCHDAASVMIGAAYERTGRLHVLE
jgi:hypothetical protein